MHMQVNALAGEKHTIMVEQLLHSLQSFEVEHSSRNDKEMLQKALLRGNRNTNLPKDGC